MASARRYDLVAFDLDGTLLRSDGTISARSMRAVRAAAAAGAVLAIVTGRPHRWLDDLHELLQACSAAICLNGALVVELPTRAWLATVALDVSDAQRFAVELRARLPAVRFAVETPTDFACEPGYRQFRALPGAVVGPIASLLNEGVAKILVQDPTVSMNELQRIAMEVGRDAVYVSYASPSVLEVCAPRATKAHALEVMAGRLGVPAERVLAFGDMPNDIPMLCWAGCGVAVANAHPDVRAIADEVTASNDDHGVAAILEREFPQAG